jgi:hypothetical protein
VKPANKRRHVRDLAVEKARLTGKQEGIGPDGVNGDGPLTTTITPSLVVGTATITTDATTIYATAYTTMASTVDPTPATTTVYSGTDFVASTTTLAQVT